MPTTSLACRSVRPAHPAAAAAAALVASLSSPAAVAAVHTCTDPLTRAVTISQQPCPDAGAPSPAQAASRAETGRRFAIAEAERARRARADRQLLAQYPDEATHREAEYRQLQAVAALIDEAVLRLAVLMAERKPLDIEREFYRDRTLPAPLQARLDASDGRLAGLTSAFEKHRGEVASIVDRFAQQRAHLVPLWAGARPGSADTYPGPASPSASR
jgi:hypothetical protein